MGSPLLLKAAVQDSSRRTELEAARFVSALCGAQVGRSDGPLELANDAALAQTDSHCGEGQWEPSSGYAIQHLPILRPATPIIGPSSGASVVPGVCSTSA